MLQSIGKQKLLRSFAQQPEFDLKVSDQ